MSAYCNETDEQLMRQLRRGDEEAFVELYQRYSQRMLRYFYRMLGGNEEKSQDFLQELFMKLIEKSHLYNPERKFSTWLFTLATNMCKNEYRSLEVRKIMTVKDDMSGVSDYAQSIEEYLDQRQFQDSLHDALQELSPHHKQVFVLRYQQDLSIKEISEIVDCAEGTIKSRIFYALRKLSDKLAVFKGLNSDR